MKDAEVIQNLEKGAATSKRTVIVIGGSSGIGYETCLRLVNSGYNVINVSRTPCTNSRVKNVSCDVAAGSTLCDVIKLNTEKYSVSAIVYCAGFSMAAPVEYAKESDIRYLFDVNYFGAVKAIQASLPYLKNTGGKIVLVGSLGGDIPIVFDSFYSSSKAALEMLARSLYGELKPYGVSITAVLPGGTATGFTYKRKVYSSEETKSYSKNVNKAVAALANFEQSGMSAAQVAEVICKILAMDKPPIIKACGAKNVAFRYFGKIMPEKLTLFLDGKAFNQ